MVILVIMWCVQCVGQGGGGVGGTVAEEVGMWMLWSCEGVGRLGVGLPYELVPKFVDGPVLCGGVGDASTPCRAMHWGGQARARAREGGRRWREKAGGGRAKVQEAQQANKHTGEL